MTMNMTLFARFCTAGLGKVTVAIFVIISTVGLARAGAQQINVISFDAPGADTTAGSFNGTFASGVNNWGTIAGYYLDVNEVYHGFLRTSDGNFTTFEAPGADTTKDSYNGTTPSSINDLGVIAGSYYDATGFGHGFLRYPDGKFTTFEVPGAGGYGSAPLAIDLEGAVVGYYTNSNFSFRAFLRSPDGKFKTWIGPGACTGNGSEGCFGSGASNINVFGMTVGGYEDNSGNFVHHSFVRSSDGELTTFDAPGAGTGGYQGTGCPGCALGFNLAGAVAGTFVDANSVQHGFLRNPDGRFTTFDAPGAGTSSYEGTGCPADCPTSLNDWGTITGIYIDVNYVYHGYLRSPNGSITTVDPAGSIFTWSSGIDDLGEITGYYADVNDVYHGFVAVPCYLGCFEKDDSTIRVGTATNTNRVHPALNRVLNPKPRLIP